MSKRYTIAVDFDGVLHSYTTPWVNAHTIPDPPVKGAIRWLEEMNNDFDVVILSTRCNTWRGRRAVRRWIRAHSGPLSWWDGYGSGRPLREVKTPKVSKPPALIYLDDRAVRFNGPGSFPTKNDVHRARPWNKSP